MEGVLRAVGGSSTVFEGDAMPLRSQADVVVCFKSELKL